MIRQYAIKILPLASSKDKDNLLIVVRDFSIEDRPVQGEMATFYARIEFYVTKDHKKYTPLLKVDSFFETTSAWDVTNAIKKYPSKKMAGWFDLAVKNLNKKTDETLTLDAIKDWKKTRNEQYPVYSSTPKKGVYYSIEHFLRANPPDTNFIKSAYYTDGYKDIMFFSLGEGKKKKGKNLTDTCFAIYDGEKWYKNTALGFREMKLIDGDFYYVNLAQGSRQSDGAAIMFGILGSAIASKSKGSVVVKVRLDPDTGEAQCIQRL